MKNCRTECSTTFRSLTFEDGQIHLNSREGEKTETPPTRKPLRKPGGGLLAWTKAPQQMQTWEAPPESPQCWQNTERISRLSFAEPSGPAQTSSRPGRGRSQLYALWKGLKPNLPGLLAGQ